MDEINVVPFKFKYLPLLIEMLKDREADNIDEFTMKHLPKIGYIALIGDQPVAAGFLRKVEGNIMAHIDGLTSNPYFGSIIRHNGITMVLERLIQDAKDMKLKGITAYTLDNSVLMRAEAIGFYKVEHSTIALRL